MSQDFSRVFLEALRYLQGKGQIPSAFSIAVLLLVDQHIKEEYGAESGLREFVENYIRYSELERSHFQTVYQRNLAEVFASIKQQVTVQQQTSSPVRVIEEFFSGRRKEQQQP